MASHAPQEGGSRRYILEQMRLVNRLCNLDDSADPLSNLSTLGEKFKNGEMGTDAIQRFSQLLVMCLKGETGPLAMKAIDVIITGVVHFASLKPYEVAEPLMLALLNPLDEGVFSVVPPSMLTGAGLKALSEIVNRCENVTPRVFSIFTPERLACVNTAALPQNDAYAYWFLANYLILHDTKNTRIEKLRSVMKMVEKFLFNQIHNCGAVNEICRSFITFLQKGPHQLVDELLPHSNLIRLLVDHSKNDSCRRTCHKTIFLLHELLPLCPNSFGHMIRQDMLHIIVAVLKDVPSHARNANVLDAACRLVKVVLTHPIINSIDEIINSRVMGHVLRMWSNVDVRETAIDVVNLFIKTANVRQLHGAVTAGMLSYLPEVIGGADTTLQREILKMLERISLPDFNAEQKRNIVEEFTIQGVPEFINARHEFHVKIIAESIRVFLTP